MSIKYKISSIVLVVFILNAILLGGYYRFVLSIDLSENMEAAQEKLERIATQAAKLVEGSDSSRLFSEVFAQEAQLAKYNITVTDLDSHIIVYEKGFQSDKPSLYAVALAKSENTGYMIKVQRFYDITNLKSIVIVQKLILYELLAVFLLLFLLVLVMHGSFVKPLLQLNSRMLDFRRGIRKDPVKIKRGDEIGQLEKQFAEIIKELDEEKQLQKRMISSISHDIKTPLTSVMGYVERLQKSKTLDEERLRRYLQTIYNRSQNIGELIEEFDEYISSNLDTNPLKLQQVKVTDLYDFIKKEYVEELLSRGIQLSVDCALHNTLLRVDLSKLRRVFNNIITNAVRYIDKESPKITVEFLRCEAGIKIVFSDNGSGVDEEEYARIFEPFYTTDHSRKSGSGLGLSICKNIIEAHGGNIYACKSTMNGLAVVIELPEV